MADNKSSSQLQVYLDACTRDQVTPNSAVQKQLESQDVLPRRNDYNMSQNLVGDRGAIPLIEAIDLDFTFKRISLRGNSIRNKACQALTQMLAKHPHVVEVDLRDNIISLGGAQALLQLATTHPGLKTLHIENNKIPASLHLKIRDALGDLERMHVFAASSEALQCRVAIITGFPSGVATLCHSISSAFGLVDIQASSLMNADATAKDATAAETLTDENAVGLIKQAISDAEKDKKAWMLHMLPRTQKQAELLTNEHISPDLIIRVEIPTEAIVENLTNRRLDPETGQVHDARLLSAPFPAEVAERLVHRHADTEEVVRPQVMEAKANADAVAEYYEQLEGRKDLVMRIDGSGLCKLPPAPEEHDKVKDAIAAHIRQKHDTLSAAAVQIQSLCRGNAARAQMNSRNEDEI